MSIQARTSALQVTQSGIREAFSAQLCAPTNLRAVTTQVLTDMCQDVGALCRLIHGFSDEREAEFDLRQRTLCTNVAPYHLGSWGMDLSLIHI